MAGGAGEYAVPQQLPGRLGAVSAPCRRGRPVSVAADRGRQGRATRRSLLSQRPRAALGGCAGIAIARSVARMENCNPALYAGLRFVIRGALGYVSGMVRYRRNFL